MTQGRLVWRTIVALVLLSAMTGVSVVSYAQGNAPEIVFAGFSNEIDADGVPNYGYISFKDLDKDLSQVRFVLVAGQGSNLAISPGWQFDPGMQGERSGTLQFTIAAQASGHYELQVILVDAMDNESAPEKISFIAGSVVGNLPPVAAFSISRTTAKVGEPIIFDASASTDADGTIVGYEWEYGDGSSASGQQVTHAYDSAGSYTVSLTVIDDVGDFSTMSRSVEVSNCDINIWGELSHLVEGVQKVQARERVCFYTTWFADTKEQVEAFVNSVRCVHTIEGETLTVLRKDWSEPRQVYDPDLGLVWQTTWTYVTEPLKPGDHNVHVRWEYAQDVFDGQDVVPAGTVYETTTRFEVVE